MSVSAPIHLPIICKASPIFIGLLFRNRSGVINQLGQVYPGGASCANSLIIESKRFSSDREGKKKPFLSAVYLFGCFLQTCLSSDSLLGKSIFSKHSLLRSEDSLHRSSLALHHQV